MGSTAVAALLTKNELIFLHAGDSRCYVVRETQIVARTADHSMSAQIERGGAPPSGIFFPVYSNIVTSCIGGPGEHSNLTVDPTWDDDRCAGVVALRPADLVLLFSDGLWNNMSDDTIVEMARASLPDVSAVVETLAGHALEMGGHDNITVAAVRIVETTQEAE